MSLVPLVEVRNKAKEQDCLKMVRINILPVKVSKSICRPILTPSLVLDTVPEHAEVHYPELNPSDAPDVAIDFDEIEFGDFSSAHSGITSFTQDELWRLDQESMINALPFLYQYSDSLLNLFSSQDVAQLQRLHDDLQEPTSRASKRLSTMREGFMLNSKHYGDDMPINLEIAVLALTGMRQTDRVLDELRRPDPVLHLANLAWCISTLYASKQDTDDAKDLLESIFNDFPALFGMPQGHHQSGAFSLVLELRTQFLLQELSVKRNRPAFDADETLRDIFYCHHDRLRGLDYNDKDSTLPSLNETIFTKRIAAIRRHFSNDISNPVDFDRLRQKFPYMNFLVCLAQWAQSMVKEHQSAITDFGGISQIQSQLQDEFERRQSREENRLTASGQSRGTTVTKATNLRDDADPARVPALTSSGEVQTSKVTQRASGPRKSLEWRIKQQQKKHEMEANLQARKATEAAKNVQATIPQVERAPAYDVQPEGDDELDLPSPPRTQGVPANSQLGRTVLAVIDKQRLQSNKENIDISRGRKLAFLDRQPGAVRLAFDSQESAPAAGTKSSSKRKAQEDEDDDEERAFEVDERTAQAVPHKQTLNQIRRVGRETRKPNAATTESTSRGSPSKRARLEPNRRSSDDDEDDDNVAAGSELRREEADRNRYRRASSVSSTERVPLRERHNNPPSSSAPALGISEAPPFATQFVAVNREARDNTARRLVKRKMKQPQQRSRWTDEEIERLVELIGEYGVSWSNLLREDEEYETPALQERDQVALKDKARNMKMDFLKCEFLFTALDFGRANAEIELVPGYRRISNRSLLGPGLLGCLTHRALCIMNVRYDKDDAVSLSPKSCSSQSYDCCIPPGRGAVSTEDVHWALLTLHWAREDPASDSQQTELSRSRPR